MIDHLTFQTDFTNSMTASGRLILIDFVLVYFVINFLIRCRAMAITPLVSESTQ